jgi:hypothetical protein
MGCDGGFRLRNVSCINGQICSSKTKPHINESCFHSSCFSTKIPVDIANNTMQDGSSENSIYADILLHASLNSSKLDKTLSNINNNVLNSTPKPISYINESNYNLYVNVVTATSTQEAKLFKNKETDDDNYEDIKPSFVLKLKSKALLSTKKQKTFSTKKPKIPAKIKISKKNFLKPSIKKILSKSLRSLSILNDNETVLDANSKSINADVLITVPHTSKFFLNSTIIQSLTETEQDHDVVSTTTITTSKSSDQMDYYFYGTDMDLLAKELDEYEWVLGEFTNCSRECGKGFRSRKIECRSQSLSSGGGELVDDLNCLAEPKPNAFEACNTRQCLDWSATEWSDVIRKYLYG